MGSTLPLVEQWRRKVPDRDRLVVVNGESFPLKEILESLGLHEKDHERYAFGLADEDEIRARLGLQCMFHESAAFRAVVQQPAAHGALPTTERDFLRYFDPARPHTVFWQHMHDFLAAVDAYPNVPQRVARVADALRASLHLEQAERSMAGTISAEVLKAATLAGVVTFTVSTRDENGHRRDTVMGLRTKDAAVGGHRFFSRDAAKMRLVPSPQWTEKLEHKRGFRGEIARGVRAAVNGINWAIKRTVFRPMVVGGSSSAIEEDLRDVVMAKLRTANWSAWATSIEGASVQVFFRYSMSGLEVRMLRVDLQEPDDERGLSDDIVAFPGYSVDQYRTMRRVNEVYCTAARTNGRMLRTAKLHAFVEEQSPGFFLGFFRATSPHIDAMYRWSAIRALYESREHRPVSAAVEKLRAYFAHQLNELRGGLYLYQTIHDRAEKLGLPFCIPEVADGEHVVDFTHLYPTQLLLRMKPGEAVPIDGLPELNGRMIGLTGKHGGGKTETQLAVVTNIYLAQSGLPVFADGFRWNIKKVLGIVFISQRGTGSTAQQYLAKLRNVLEAARKVDGKHVVLILDEVGTGTQEEAGLLLGTETLQRLAARGASILFSTQIMRLAEFSQRELGALCVQFDAKHRITAGIADGGMAELREQMGIDRLLKELEV